jgi:lambda family phage portal protein
MFDQLGELVDRVVLAWNPERGIQRMELRRAHHRYEERRDGDPQMSTFDGADRNELRAHTWLGSRLSTDSALELDLEDLRKKSRELYRTDSIGGAIDTRTNLVVSYGFTPQAQIYKREGLATEDDAKRWNEELEDVYERIYPGISKCGTMSLWEVTELAEQCIGCDGEALVILHDRGAADRPIPLTLEVVDVERLRTPPELAGNPQVRLGIEYDATGLVVAYHVQDSHPHDTLDVKETYTRYPANRVVHVFKRWFPGQSRGLPWLTRALNRCKDAKDLDEAAIIAAQVEACHAAIVTTPNGFQSAEQAATGRKNGKRTQDIHPGTIQYLDQGQTVQFSQPNRGSGYESMQEWNYRRAAAGMAFPYEMLAKNWVGLSFAGGRLSLTEGRLFVRAEQKRLRESLLLRVWNRIVEESVIVGACSIPPRLYERAPWFFQTHEWSDPAWPFALTPREEVDAAIELVDNNIRTKASVVGEYGGNLEEVFAARKKEREAERTMQIEPLATKYATVAREPQQTQQELEAAAA